MCKNAERQQNVEYTKCHDEQSRYKIWRTFSSINDFEIREHVIKHEEDIMNSTGDSPVIEVLSLIVLV